MPHRYFDPTTDFGFKRLFGQEESKEILKGFLFDILTLPHPIDELSYIPSEQLPASPTERAGIYDIYCKDTAGNRFIVEMQRSPVHYFKERALFYATFPIIQQIEKGTVYNFRLLPVYCVSVLRYRMDEEPSAMRRIQLANVETGKIFYDGLTFVFIELPKFTLSIEQVETPTDRWLYLLKHLPELEAIPVPLNVEPFPQAFKIAEMGAMSEKERAIYRENIKRISDERAILETQFFMGQEVGREEGREEGERAGLLAGIELALEIKFGDEGKQLFAEMSQIHDLEKLQAISHTLRTARTGEEIRAVFRGEQ
jgi:predicted transposase/invertase (TIGR01784 family)